MAEADREQAVLRAGSAPGSTGGLLVVRDARVLWGREHVVLAGVQMRVSGWGACCGYCIDTGGWQDWTSWQMLRQQMAASTMAAGTANKSGLMCEKPVTT